MRAGRYQVREGWDGWIQVKPGYLEGLPDDGHRAAELALLTMHGSGFVREAAVRKLALGALDVVFPFVLMRANDWVEPVRRLSADLVLAFLRPGSEAVVARSLPLILKFQEYGRGQHDSVRLALRAYLESGAGIATLHDQLRGGDTKARRAVVRFLAGSEPSLQLEFVEEALADPDGVVRRWGARQFEEFERAEPHRAQELSRRMFHDPSAAIRLEGIYAFVRRGTAAAVPELTSALLDPAASVRHAARYYLREGKAPIALDFASHYRACLNGGIARLTAAIAGLAETGTGDDARLLDAFFEHSSARVVRAALTAQARLDQDGSRDRRLAALVDPRPGVTRHALRLLERRLRQADARTLEELAARVATPEAADTLTRAAAKLPVWTDLLVLLWLAVRADPDVSGSAIRELAAWEPVDRPAYAVPAPDPSAGAEIVARLAGARKVLPLPVTVRLERILKPYLRLSGA